jgi:hypothetical protein
VGTERDGHQREVIGTRCRPLPLPRRPEQGTACHAGGDADPDAGREIGYRARHEVGSAAGLAGDKCERDSDHRCDEAVVQSTFDVQDPAHPARNAPIRDDARAEAGVGRGEDRPHEQRLSPVRAAEERRGDDGSEDDA